MEKNGENPQTHEEAMLQARLVIPPDYAELENRFRYHPPMDGQPERYGRIRAACLDLAKLIVDLTPISREQAAALTQLDGVMMFANAAIARREP